MMDCGPTNHHTGIYAGTTTNWSSPADFVTGKCNCSTRGSSKPWGGTRDDAAGRIGRRKADTAVEEEQLR